MQLHFPLIILASCNRTVGYNRTVEAANHTKSTQLIHNSNNHLSKEKFGNFQTGGIFNKRHCRQWRY